MLTMKQTNRVGGVEFGGLRQLAIQFIAQWGCKVTIYHLSEGTKEDVLRSRATVLLLVNDEESKSLQNMNLRKHLIVASSVQIDWQLYLSALTSLGGSA